MVRDLIQAGHQVTSVDLAPAAVPGVWSLIVDLTDAGQIYQALTASQAEAVIHLGAWSGDHIVPATRTYGDNVQGTFNVFQACADLGIRRVVWASTHHVYGVIKASPVYVPIDEAHPLRPTTAYALSNIARSMTGQCISDIRSRTRLDRRSMYKEVTVPYGHETKTLRIPAENLAWIVGPKDAPR